MELDSDKFSNSKDSNSNLIENGFSFVRNMLSKSLKEFFKNDLSVSYSTLASVVYSRLDSFWEKPH